MLVVLDREGPWTKAKVAKHLSLQPAVNHAQYPCLDLLLRLDNGYQLYERNATSGKLGFVLLTHTTMERPRWVVDLNRTNVDMSRTRIPGCLNGAFEYDYVQGTRWYTFQQFQLQLMDFFDYVFKVDADIMFYKQAPEHPAQAPFPNPFSYCHTSIDGHTSNHLC